MSEPQLLCTLEEIPEGGSKGLELDGAPVFAVRKNDQVYLYENNCPHDQIPLEWEEDQFLDESGSLIECANHGAIFTIETGECVAGPCMGSYLDAVPCEVSDGKVYARPED